MALYQKLPRSRLKSNMDGEDTIVSYRNASPKARASAAPYESPPSARKGDRLDYKAPQAGDLSKKGRSSSPVVQSSPSANVRKEDYSKGSTSAPAYKGQDGDKPAKRGAVTSYNKDGYTYMKNAQGNYQNFKAGPVPTVKKKDMR